MKYMLEFSIGKNKTPLGKYEIEAETPQEAKRIAEEYHLEIYRGSHNVTILEDVVFMVVELP